MISIIKKVFNSKNSNIQQAVRKITSTCDIHLIQNIFEFFLEENKVDLKIVLDKQGKTTVRGISLAEEHERKRRRWERRHPNEDYE